MRPVQALLLTSLGWLAAACTNRATPSVESSPSSVGAPAPSVVVAFGDVHGDLFAARAALRLAGAIDERDAWSGGSLIVVQTGDWSDRGDDDKEGLELFLRLRDEARRAGGAFHFLLGNHELLNAKGDMRYASAKATAAFAAWPGLVMPTHGLEDVAPKQRARVAAFRPTGPVATALARGEVVHREQDTLFVHGGLTPAMAKHGIDAINAEARDYLLGKRQATPLLADEQGPVWSRAFSGPAKEVDCGALEQALALTQAKRLVVGHTVQKAGITSACNGRVWRIDVGMSGAVDGLRLEALRIEGDDVRVLRR